MVSILCNPIGWPEYVTAMKLIDFLLHCLLKIKLTQQTQVNVKKHIEHLVNADYALFKEA